MTQPLVSVITATTGNPLLSDNLHSVSKQTYKNIQHLLFVDGEHNWDKADTILHRAEHDVRRNVLKLPYPTGNNRWNGHRMYGAGTFLCEGEYVIFLDDDNYLEPTHVEECIEAVRGFEWAYSFRKIVDKDRNFLCNDDCESLGKWPSVLNSEDYFVDVNCYFLSRKAAVSMVPVWYRKFREPGIMEIDRAMILVLKQMFPDFGHTKNYTVNYTVGNTEHSVKGDFFLRGNEIMLQRHSGHLPWKDSNDKYVINF